MSVAMVIVKFVLLFQSAQVHKSAYVMDEGLAYHPDSCHECIALICMIASGNARLKLARVVLRAHVRQPKCTSLPM